MKVTASEYQLQLIDRVVEGGTYGKDRSAVLNSIVLEHAMYLATGGEPDDMGGGQDILEVIKADYGPKRNRFILEPITGKAVPVYKGEVFRVVQVEGGQCIDFNGYSLQDYKEYLNCGFNRTSGMSKGKGTIVWSGSPRWRPMYAILDCDERFDQYFEGHRCNAILFERSVGFVGHPNCQDTFAEAIREYGLTPDDVHTSYNLWMHVTLDARGRRIRWNRAQKGDYVDLLALFDTLCVPVICGGDLSPCNNFDYAPVEICIFEASQATLELVDLIQSRFGRYQSQMTPSDFKVKGIRAQRELISDPSYKPEFIPAPRKITFELNISPEMVACLQSLMKTGIYGASEAKALIACFMRWHSVTRSKNHVAKLLIREK